MKTIKLIFLITTLSFAFGCKKKGCMDLKAENYNRFATVDDGTCTFNDYSLSESVITDYNPKFNDNSGTLVAIDRGYFNYQNTPHGIISSWHGNNLAHFDEISNDNYLSCGELNTNLNINIGTVYFKVFKTSEHNFYNLTQAFPLGGPHGFPDTIRYIASGDLWPAFTVKTTLKLPNINTINAGDISPSTSYKINMGSVTADSIAVGIFGKKGRLLKVVPGNQTSCEFSGEEINTLGNGTAYISVTTLNYETQTVDSRLYHIVNGRNVIKTVFSY